MIFELAKNQLLPCSNFLVTAIVVLQRMIYTDIGQGPMCRLALGLWSVKLKG
jgi:hypothetical protein